MRRCRSGAKPRKLDPNLALAWAMLSIVETSPESAHAAREKARNLIEHQPQGGVDDLLIRWIVSRSETELMYSIQVANDLVSEHPDRSASCGQLAPGTASRCTSTIETSPCRRRL